MATKKDLVLEYIREAILYGELASGDRLLQEELAERFNISPTPIREALRQLEAEGILEHSPYRGVQVAEVRLEDVREIYLIRSELEALATRVAVPVLSTAHVQRLRNLHEEIRGLVGTQDYRTVRKLNYQVHMVIYQTANMPTLLKLIKMMWAKSPWDTILVLPGRAEAATYEHEKLIKAIEAGDSLLAGQRMREHIEQGALDLQDYMLSRRAGDMSNAPQE